MSSEPQEFKSQFNTDESYRSNNGQGMSVLGPGAGEQRSTIEGALGAVKNLLLRPEGTKEQIFRRDASQYLEKMYRKESGWGRSFVEEALEVPNYHNLYLGMLMASLYFRQLSGVRDYDNLTLEILDKHSVEVLKPLVSLIVDTKKIRKATASEYQVQLKADLLRYLRLILKKK